MVITKTARETLTAIEMDKGDEVHFSMTDGTRRRIVLESTFSDVQSTTLTDFKKPQRGATSEFRCHCRLRIDGVAVELARWFGNQLSFNPPWEFFGLRIWFDGTQDLFDYMLDNHNACKPRKHARFVFQDASKRICPPLLHPWCPLPAGGIQIKEHCYDGVDCWMGPYFGSSAHGGLDLNHPAGTPLWAPIDIHEQTMYESIDKGANNNRWRGIHRWPDGSAWILKAAHLIHLTVPEDRPISAGMQYALSAGMATGSHEHTHFMFSLLEPGAKFGEEINLDPWILFWQMYQDRKLTTM